MKGRRQPERKGLDERCRNSPGLAASGSLEVLQGKRYSVEVSRISPDKLIRPRRRIEGASAVLLPFSADGSVDYEGFERHLERTFAAGLVPAVNMDTGYVHLIAPATRQEVLRRTQSAACGRRFVAGVFVDDRPGDAWAPDRYWEAVARVLAAGGIPIVFQSFGMAALAEERIADAYRAITADCAEFIFFELGTMFAPFGRIYSLETYSALVEIENCSGGKHSSLSRRKEWDRLALRDRVRPDFRVYSGNDLAIDMVIYGSDYLLGVSTMAPDLFALRDRFWENGDERFHELNDLLQYLGMFAFRAPVPAYRHSAAQLLKLQGWIRCDAPAPGAPARPAADVAVLAEIRTRLDDWRQFRAAEDKEGEVNP